MVKKDFWKRYVFSLERKSEGVMDDDSGDDKGEEDWLRQGGYSETGSLLQRWGEACQNERFVIFNEELEWKSDKRGSASTARRLQEKD